MHVHTDTAWSASVDFYTLYKVQSVPETQVHLLIPQAIQSRALSSLCGACIIRQTSYTNHPELKKNPTMGPVVSSLLVPPYTLQTLNRNIQTAFGRNSDTGPQTDFFWGLTFEYFQS